MRQQPKHNQEPHRTFGKVLRTMRQRLQESLGETSGAVEIGVEQLDRYERGAELPSEDILMLLISHFNLTDEEALKVWEMAGYDRRSQYFEESERSNEEEGRAGIDETHLRQSIQVMLVALDNRIVYTNNAEVVMDDMGVVIHFNQSDPGQSQVVPVSKVGMSYAQAEQLLNTLQRALLHKRYLSGPKQLPPQTNVSDNQDIDR